MNKILKFLKKFPSIKFSISNPPKKKIIIFDDETSNDLRHVLNEDQYYLLKIRFDNIDTLHINFSIIFNTLINYSGNLWTSYIVTLINLVSPNIVITCSDNNYKFSEISKILKDKVKFYAVQNGARYDLNRHNHNYKIGKDKENKNNIFHLENFFCFGEYEVTQYKENNIFVKNFYPVGSIRLSNFLTENNFEKKDDFSLSHKYDVLLISDGLNLDFDDRFNIHGGADATACYINFLIKYVKKNKKKFLCSFKRVNSSKGNLLKELKFYEHYLSREDYNFLIKNSNLDLPKSRDLTYKLMLQSKLVISCYSTILRENLSLGRKSLSINFMKNDLFKFPLDGICSLGNCEYTILESRINEILELSDEEFIKRNNYRSNYLMSFDKNFSTIDRIKDIINQ